MCLLNPEQDYLLFPFAPQPESWGGDEGILKGQQAVYLLSSEFFELPRRLSLENLSEGSDAVSLGKGSFLGAPTGERDSGVQSTTI